MTEAEQDIYSTVKDNPSKLLKLLDKDSLRSLLDDFTGATGLTANIIGTDGKSIFSRADAQKMCTFCKLVRKLQKKTGVNRCVRAYERVGKEAAKDGEASVFRCPAGLVECVTPIMVGDMHVGSVICGQILMWKPDEYFEVELEQCNRGITDDMQPLIDAAKELQVVPVDKMHAASRLLGVIADKIVGSLWEEINHRRELEYQKDLLERERLTRRKLEGELDAYSASYSLDQNRALVGAIMQNDYKEARRIFAVLLADDVSANLPYENICARLYDLVFSVSHAVASRTRDVEACENIVASYCKSTWFVSSNKEFAAAAKSAFEELIGLAEKSTKPHKRSVEAMCKFIQAHLSEAFSLQDVAESVGLSTYYASRIFKEDQGVTIMEYATDLRINEAKLLLANPKYRIDEIAAHVGYADSSYFSRVFKKHEGMSPREYRACH